MKKIAFFICLSFMFLLCGVTCFFAPTKNAFAEGENDIEVSDIVSFMEANSANSFQGFFRIGEGEYVSKTVSMLQADGTEFIYEPSVDDETRVVDPSSLPLELVALSYNNDSFALTAPSNQEAIISLKYKVVFTFADSSTLEKTADITIVFHNVHIGFVDGEGGEEIYEVDCELNTPLTPESFKQYIDQTKTTVDIDDITAKFIGSIDFSTITNGVVKFTYENPAYEISGKTISLKIEKSLGINVDYPVDWQGVTLEIGDGNTYSEELDLGEIEYSRSWEYSGKLKSNVSNIHINFTNTQNFLVVIEETADFGVYDFTIYSKTVIEGEQIIDFTANFDSLQSNIATLKLNFKISATPIISLQSKDIVLSKSVKYNEVVEEINNNLVYVVDVLGDVVDISEVVINKDSLSSIYEGDDIVECGDYVVTYSFTSKTLTSRVCTTTETVNISVINNKPTMDKANISVKVDEVEVENNGQVNANKTLDVSIPATDLNGDTIIFIVELSVASNIVANDADTSVIANSTTQYTITAVPQGNTSTVKFKITPNGKYYGDFAFTVSAYDDGAHIEPGDTFDFEIEYYETGLPVLVLLTSGMEWDSEEEVYVLAIEQENTARNLLTQYVVRAEDEYDKNVNNASVVITVTKNSEEQKMVGKTFTFNTPGVYYVNYSLSDKSGNTTTAKFKVDVSEIPNYTPTISPYILYLNEAMDKDFAYKEVISINIDKYFTIFDADTNDSLTYFNESGVFVAADTSSQKILCTNYESFSWNGHTLTFKQDKNAYYLGTVYIAIFVDDNTGLASGVSDPAFIKISFVNNVPPTVTQVPLKTTYVIGRDDSTTFNKTAFFTATHDYDKSTITPVVDILNENGENVSTIDFTTVGNYTLNYYFKYEQGGKEHIIQRSVVIKVTTGNIPNIVLKQEDLKIAVGGDFDISTIITRVEDIEDGNANYETIKDKITIEGMPADFNTPGEYKITISYKDSDNNQVSKVFTLKIVEQSKVWIYIVIGVGSAAVVAGLVVLIVFLVRRRYTRI